MKSAPPSLSSLLKCCRIASEANSLHTWENLFTPWDLFSYVRPTAGKLKNENIGKNKKCTQTQKDLNKSMYGRWQRWIVGRHCLLAPLYSLELLQYHNFAMIIYEIMLTIKLWFMLFLNHLQERWHTNCTLEYFILWVC